MKAAAAVRAIVVTGAGGKFSYGADIKDFAMVSASETKTVQDTIAPVATKRRLMSELR